MKLIISLRFSPLMRLALFSLILILTACSGSNGKSEETATVDTPDVDTTPPEGSLAYITNLGIGQVKVGMRISDILPSSPGLYDRITEEEGYESTSFNFINQGHSRFVVYEFGSGLADVVAASDNTVAVETPDGDITLGMPFATVVSLPECEPEFQSLDGEGMWVWRWRGLYFQPSQNDLPSTLSSKLYNAATTPELSDFPSNVTVDYIGTGLPF